MEQDRHALAVAGEVLLSLLVIVAATAAGALLLAIAESGHSTLQALTLQVAIPAAAFIALVLALAAAVGWRRLVRAVLLGFWTGALATAALELVRNVGFHVFQSMPGDIPRLMGVLITGRIMEGPNVWSDVIGWTDHVWNGAMFGIVYVVLIGGFPRQGSRWVATGVGAIYGALLATGFMLSSIPTTTGAGTFGAILGPKFGLTVYLAHLGFGTVLGWLVHEYGQRLEPLWELILARRAAFRRAIPSTPPVRLHGTSRHGHA